MTFIDLLKKRRSIYALGRNVNNEAEIIDTIETTVKYSPSAFNSQTSRIKIVLDDAQDKLWGELIPTALHKTMQEQGVPESAWGNTKKKLAGFQAGYGTVLFYEDQASVKKMQEDFPLYADKFPIYSAQSTGIAAVNTWNALAELGIGANLQHYNPVVDTAIAEAFNIPANYQLESQLVFGSIEGSVDEKTFISDAEHFEVIK